MQPIIGIACRTIVDYEWNPPLVGVRRGYIDAVIDAGGVPLLLPPGVASSVLRRMYDTVDGVLLSGGADIDPSLYGEERHPKLGMLEPERDMTELSLVRWAVAEGKPLFAICRGMQVLNVALGGTLYQDIGSQYPTPLEHDTGSIEHRWDRKDHPMHIEPASHLAAVLGSTDVGVNSLHHQAVKTIPPQLRAVAHAPDGMVEAVEGTNGAFVVGVQCHPEQLWNGTDTRWRNVFRAFVEAAAVYRVEQAQTGANSEHGVAPTVHNIA
jgi:putative glutamine amidotransferase